MIKGETTEDQSSGPEELQYSPDDVNDKSTSGLVLSGPHLEMSARQAILQAVDTLEEENERLHKHNRLVLVEVEQLRRENAELRRELAMVREDYEHLAENDRTLELERGKLREELERSQRQWSEEGQRLRELETLNNKYVQQLEEAKEQMSVKDRELQMSLRNLENASKKLESSSRKNFNERDIELMHEVALLKEEKKDIIQEKDELARTNTKLRNELANIQTSLEQKIAELKNENRRHALLTKEFNSLLEENNHLKTQLRGRLTSRSETRASRQPTVQTIHRINSEPSTLFSAKRFGSMTGLQMSSRDLPLGPPRGGPPRDYTSIGTERNVTSRERSAAGRPVTLARANKAASRTGTRGSKDGLFSSEHEDVTIEFISDSQSISGNTISDTLPSIDNSGRTWKP